MTFEDLTAAELRTNPHMQNVLRQAIKHQFAKAKIDPALVQVSLGVPADDASNTIAWHTKIDDGANVDFAKVRGVIAEAVSTLSMAESIHDLGEVSDPKVRPLKVTDMTLRNTATDKTHYGGAAGLSNVTKKIWKQHEREFKLAANKALNDMAMAVLGENAGAFMAAYGRPLATAVSFERGEAGGRLDVEWSFDDGVVSQMPECKKALDELNASLQTANGLGALNTAFMSAAAEVGIPGDLLTRSRFRKRPTAASVRIAGDFDHQLVRCLCPLLSWHCRWLTLLTRWCSISRWFVQACCRKVV